ncbi:MAG: universal stress protein [Chloroflexota bacterium]
MKILIFVSSHNKSKPAVLFGGLLAKKTNASITLLTVIDEPHVLDTAHQTLEKARKWIPDLNATTAVRINTDVNGILTEIDSGEYDLLIIRARQATQLKDFLRTKIGRRAARQSPISVLVIKQEHTELNRILICTSGVDLANPVIEKSVWLAKSSQAKVTLLHVAGSVPSMYTGLDKIEEQLHEILETDTPMAQHLRHAVNMLVNENINAELKLRHGSVPDEILHEARSGNYNLIVLGASKAFVEFAGWLLGNVAQQIVDQADCPVLVVRQATLNPETKD